MLISLMKEYTKEYLDGDSDFVNTFPDKDQSKIMLKDFFVNQAE